MACRVCPSLEGRRWGREALHLEVLWCPVHLPKLSTLKDRLGFLRLPWRLFDFLFLISIVSVAALSDKVVSSKLLARNGRRWSFRVRKGSPFKSNVRCRGVMGNEK